MGLRPWVLALSWVLAYGIIFTAVAAVITTVCCLTFLSLADPSLLFTLLWLFTASELAFGLLLTVFFSNSKVSMLSRHGIMAYICMDGSFSLSGR